MSLEIRPLRNSRHTADRRATKPLHPRVVFKGTIGREEFLDRVHKFTGFEPAACSQVPCSLSKMN